MTSARSQVTRYLLPAGMAAVAISVRWSIDSYVGDRVPFVFLMLAVLTVSTRLGFGPALLTLTIGCIATTWLFLPPRGSLLVEGIGYQVALVAFSLLGLAIAVVGERLKRARECARAYEAFLADEPRAEHEIYVATPRGVRHLVTEEPYTNEVSAPAAMAENTLGRIIAEVIPGMTEGFDVPQWQVFANGKPIANIQTQNSRFSETGTLRKWVVTYINPNVPERA